MKYFICHELGTVYWRGMFSEIHFAPICSDGTFNTEEGGVVENWEDVPSEMIKKISDLL